MSDDTMVADPPSGPPPRTPMTTGDKVRMVLRGIGQTLITLGLVVLLFVVYEVWITNLFSRAENNRLAHRLERQYAQGDDPLLGLPGSGDGSIPLGTGIANIYIPRLGRDYHWTIVEGVGQDDLAKGPGHYPQSVLPGKVGNFAVAGHRVGKGEPFLNLDKLKPDDAIVIETKSSWLVYRVKGRDHGLSQPDDADKVPGREIVDPSAGRVLRPVPDHPKFTAARRMVIHALYASSSPPVTKDGKRVEQMPANVQALYAEVR